MTEEELKKIRETLDKEYQETGTLSGIGEPMEHGEVMKTIGDIGWFANAMKTEHGKTFQERVKTWCLACFGQEIFQDKMERNRRFIEESLELVQALGCSREDCHRLVDYVFNRPSGEPSQEIGGVMTTLAALCSANDFDMGVAAECELARVWTKIEEIRLKQDSRVLYDRD